MNFLGLEVGMKLFLFMFLINVHIDQYGGMLWNSTFTVYRDALHVLHMKKSLLVMLVGNAILLNPKCFQQ